MSTTAEPRRDRAEGSPPQQPQPRRYLPALLAAVVLYVAYLLYVPFFVPLFWGAVLGTLFRPVYRYLNRRLGYRSTLASVLVTIGVFFVVLIPTLAILFEIVSELIDLFREAQQALGGREAIFSPQSAIVRYLLPLAQEIGLSAEQIRSAAAYILEQAGSFVVRLGPMVLSRLVRLLLTIFFTLIALYYAFKDGPLLVEQLKDLVPLPRREVAEIAARLHHVVTAGIFSTAVVALAQAVAAGLFFWALGLPRPLLWAVATGLVSLVPAIGAPLTWIPAFIYLIVAGEYARAGALAAVGLVVVTSIDHILRPLIIHEEVRIHNFLLFFGILGGIYLLGITGLLFGPLAVALALEVLRIYRERRSAHAPAATDPDEVAWR